MTGRKAFGEHDKAGSDTQSSQYEDPLVELARIVSEGDEFWRKKALAEQQEREGDLHQPIATEPNPGAFQPAPDDASAAGYSQDPHGYPQPGEAVAYSGGGFSEPGYDDTDADVRAFVEDAYAPDSLDAGGTHPAQTEPFAPLPYGSDENFAHQGAVTSDDAPYHDAPSNDVSTEVQPAQQPDLPEFGAVPEPYGGPDTYVQDGFAPESYATPQAEQSEPEGAAYDAPQDSATEYEAEPVYGEAGVGQRETYDSAEAYPEDAGPARYIEPDEPYDAAPAYPSDDGEVRGFADSPMPEAVEAMPIDAEPEPIAETARRPEIRLDPADLLDPTFDPAPGADADAYAIDFDDEDPYTIDPRHRAAVSESDAEATLAGAGNARDFSRPDSGLKSPGAPADAGGADDAAVDPTPEPRVDARPEQKASWGLGFKAIAAILALTIVGGAGLFAYRTFSGGAAGGDPVMITADTQPFKRRPQPTETAEATSRPGSGVYQRLSGTEQSDKSQERIVVGRENPVNVARTNDANPVPELPKTVKTVIVKPDGTFVERPAAAPTNTDQTATGSTGQQSVQRPAASVSGANGNPAGGASGQANGNAEKSSARVVATQPIRTVTTVREPEPTPPAAAEATPQSNVDVAERANSAADTIAGANPPVITSLVEAGAQGDPTVVGREPEPAAPVVDAETVLPRPKPALARPAAVTRTAAVSQPANPTPPQNTNAVEPVRATPPQRTARTTNTNRAAPASGNYIVQVSSQRSQAQAQAAYADLQRRYPSVLGNRDSFIQRANLGDRGTYYRVRLGPFEQQAAARLCNDLKAAGGDCFVRRR
ncbi:MAG: SPOR domain-containing protein [Pseudomonadota bacterium]